jgi:hypothetical protein
MAEERSQSLRPFFEVQNEVRRLFQELIHQPWEARSPSMATGWQPCCDVAETNAVIIVAVELPGVKASIPGWNGAMGALSGTCDSPPASTAQGFVPSFVLAY